MFTGPILETHKQPPAMVLSLNLVPSAPKYLWTVHLREDLDDQRDVNQKIAAISEGHSEIFQAPLESVI